MGAGYPHHTTSAGLWASRRFPLRVHAERSRSPPPALTSLAGAGEDPTPSPTPTTATARRRRSWSPQAHSLPGRMAALWNRAMLRRTRPASLSEHHGRLARARPKSAAGRHLVTLADRPLTNLLRRRLHRSLTPTSLVTETHFDPVAQGRLGDPEVFRDPEAVPRRVSAATWSPQARRPAEPVQPPSIICHRAIYPGGFRKFATLIRKVDADNFSNTNRLVGILAFDCDGRDNLDARGNGFNVCYVNRSPNP